MSDDLGKRVCIIGAGAFGLVALKNFLEEGFEVTCYERNDHIGGLWHVSDDTTQTTALSGTISNISKYMSCYSDFPYSTNASVHPRAKEVQEYLESYATSFNLWKHINLSSSVVDIERDEERRTWLVTTTRGYRSTPAQTETVTFDRLVLATGANKKPVIARIRGAELFEGDIIHSQQFKDPSKYAEKTVVVVGSGQTAADTIEFLRVAGAKKLYMSHRRSFVLVSTSFGYFLTLDSMLTAKSFPECLPGSQSRSIVTRHALLREARDRKKNPVAADEAAARKLNGLREAIWPDLRHNPAFASSREKPLMQASLPVVCDSIAQNLISGAVESVQAIDRIAGAKSVILKDGTTIDDVDAIVQCSGNTFDFGTLLPAKYNPTNPALAPEQYDSLRSTKYYTDDLTVCRAYRQFISLQEPHSLAFLGHVLSKTTLGPFPFYDLVSMALAQLWKGAAPMPSETEMERKCNQHFSHLVKMLDRSEIGHTSLVYELDHDDWLYETAGTGIPAKLGGGGWEEWKLRLTDRKLYSMLMDGLNSPHAMRMFQTGKIRAWCGARAAVEEANREVNEAGERYKFSSGS